MQQRKRSDRNTVSTLKISVHAKDWNYGKMPLDNTPVYLMMEQDGERYCPNATYYRKDGEWHLSANKKKVNLVPRIVAYKRAR